MRVRGHVRSNIVGYVAVFLAMSGSAAALQGKNTVDSGDIKPKNVKKGDLAPNSVDSSKVVDDSLNGVDINESSLDANALPQGPEDTPAQVLSKLTQVDGSGSGLDADQLDGLSSAGFVQDADQAGGDISGPFSNLQLKTGSVNSAAMGLAFFDAESLALPDVGDGSATEKVLVDAPAFDIVGRCSDGSPFGVVQVVVRSGNEVANIGVDSQAEGGVGEGVAGGDFTPGTPPADQLLLNFVASPNQIASGSFSIAALDASDLPIAQAVGNISAGFYSDNDASTGVADCFFAVSAMG